MAKHNLILIIISSFIISKVFCDNKSNANFDNLIFVRSFECSTSAKSAEKYIYPNVSCSVKKYSRKLSLANFYMMTRVPFYKIFVSRRLLRKFNLWLLFKRCQRIFFKKEILYFMKLFDFLALKAASWQNRRSIIHFWVKRCQILRRTLSTQILRMNVLMIGFVLYSYLHHIIFESFRKLSEPISHTEGSKKELF